MNCSNSIYPNTSLFQEGKALIKEEFPPFTTLKDLQLNTDPLFDKDCIEFSKKTRELTSFKIGGQAEALFCPTNEEHLKRVLIFFEKNKIPISLIGGGTNILVSDKGFKGVLINLKKINIVEIINESENFVFVKAGAGILIDELTKWAIENSLSGLENFGGLPGSVGGAVFMNARCYDTSISDIIKSVKYIEFDNAKCEFAEYKFNKKDWDYKYSPFQENANGTEITYGRKIILSAVFALSRKQKTEIAEKTELRIKDRTEKGHFNAPSAGSTFKNNRTFGIPSGKIIDEAGLRGLSIGDAQVAPWHGNFVINTGNASAKEVRLLIEKIQTIIMEQKGILLEPEIIFAGDWS